MDGLMVCRVEDSVTSRSQDCNDLAGHHPQIGRMSYLGLQRRLGTEKVG